MARLPRLLRLSHVDSPDEQHVRVLWLSGTLALGPVFALIWLALPHPAHANTTGILAMCLVAWITGSAGLGASASAAAASAASMASSSPSEVPPKGSAGVGPL